MPGELCKLDPCGIESPAPTPAPLPILLNPVTVSVPVQVSHSGVLTGFPLAADVVDAAGVDFVARHGADQMSKVAKMHFRTSYGVQGLPEPPKKEWRRK